jgi:hypothetical protein
MSILVWNQHQNQAENVSFITDVRAQYCNLSAALTTRFVTFIFAFSKYSITGLVLFLKFRCSTLRMIEEHLVQMSAEAILFFDTFFRTLGRQYDIYLAIHVFVCGSTANTANSSDLIQLT